MGVGTLLVATIDPSTPRAYLSGMEDLERIRQRIELVMDHLQGNSISAISKERGVSRPTVRKWIERYEESGVKGLLNLTSPGRPREISLHLRKEIVRLPLETRPPLDLGEQWTTRTLGQAFGISPSHIANIWQEAGIDPPLHLQQVLANPDMQVPLRIDLSAPAWFRMDLQMLLEEHDWALTEYILARLVGEDPPGASLRWKEIRAEVLEAIRDPERQRKGLLRRPVADPRQPEYLLEIMRRTGHED